MASWDYDRVRPIMDGRVRIEGCEINYLTLEPEECFHRAYINREFEVSEIGLQPLSDRTLARREPIRGDPGVSCRAPFVTRRSTSVTTAASLGPSIFAGGLSGSLSTR